ncbi:unnamed protein product [Peronospora farinosa]|uniref:Uncharacterized protein n=1 Tax=Peronospora farinosa TaxID=134698 RepID=A0AAV0U3S8_9STRA|nr:unnamed protein product [Peronospora farinosa]CAI5730515.1 unnamed protein product [Peronospora farinosa]
MAGRGRGRANTLPAWMTKQGIDAPPPAGPAPGSRPPPCAGAGPPPPPRNGQFDDAPEPAPRPPMIRNNIRESSGGKRHSRSRERGNERNGGDVRGPPPIRERSRSRSRGIGHHRDRDYGVDRRREESYRRGRSREPSREPSRGRSRSRERRDHRGDSRRGGGDRYEDRGYSARGPRNDDYRRTDGRPLRRDEEAVERGYRRPSSNGHDDRTSRRYAADYQP